MQNISSFIIGKVLVFPIPFLFLCLYLAKIHDVEYHIQVLVGIIDKTLPSNLLKKALIILSQFASDVHIVYFILNPIPSGVRV